MDEAQIIEELRSGDLERQAAALGEAARIIKSLIVESIHAFVTSQTRFPIAERLFQFGPCLIPTLEDLLKQPLDEDARKHTAALLLELGSRAGVPHLLSMLHDDRPDAPMAALLLGKAPVDEAASSNTQDPRQVGLCRRPLHSSDLYKRAQKTGCASRFIGAVSPKKVAYEHDGVLRRNSARLTLLDAEPDRLG